MLKMPNVKNVKNHNKLKMEMMLNMPKITKCQHDKNMENG